ncbi:MAG: DUF4878 domain-containing protein [Planctomycetes bacterium]|nr:DUF4878 domain-containing protein [Planctomycetota bacterium]
MTKRVYLPVAVLMLSLLLGGCGPSFSSPDGAVRIYVTAIKDKDKDKQISALCRKDREEARSAGKPRKGLNPPNLDTAELEYSQPVINEDGTAIVTVTAKLQNNKGASKFTYVLIDEDGSWKISIAKTQEYQRGGTSTGGGARNFRDGDKDVEADG